MNSLPHTLHNLLFSCFASTLLLIQLEHTSINRAVWNHRGPHDTPYFDFSNSRPVGRCCCGLEETAAVKRRLGWERLWQETMPSFTKMAGIVWTCLNHSHLESSYCVYCMVPIPWAIPRWLGELGDSGNIFWRASPSIASDFYLHIQHGWMN